LKVSPRVIIQRKLPDLPPAGVLYLQVEELVEKVSPLTWEELLAELSRQGVNYGVDWEACSRLVASCAEEEGIIARGIPATPGKDGRVELMFSPDARVELAPEEEDQVDFRERYRYTSVEPGEVLAVKHPPEPGLPGTSVRGEVIFPAPPKDCALIAGEGTLLTKDGRRVVAARVGRPVAYQRGKAVRVCILPELIHHGNVDLASGNIVFKGDVLVSNNVEEGMRVEAGGNVRVLGLVSGAEIQAAGSVLIGGNILASVVTAGGTPAFQQALLPQVQILAEGLKKMIKAIGQLQARGMKQVRLKCGIGPLVKCLLEGKFSYLFSAVNSLKKHCESVSPRLLDEQMREFLREAERILCHSSLAVQSLEEVKALAQKAEEIKECFSLSPAPESDLVGPSTLNSTLIASGNIRILGNGCYNSQIKAGKNVTIRGVFRGGEIEAGGDVHVAEIGSPGGCATKVIAGPKASVTVGFAFENASLSIGSHWYRFDRDERNIRSWLDKEGRLQYQGFPA
jgi:hypothetical protein